jgi:hypothetical protein
MPRMSAMAGDTHHHGISGRFLIETAGSVTIRPKGQYHAGAHRAQPTLVTVSETLDVVLDKQSVTAEDGSNGHQEKHPPSFRIGQDDHPHHVRRKYQTARSVPVEKR